MPYDFYSWRRVLKNKVCCNKRHTAEETQENSEVFTSNISQKLLRRVFRDVLTRCETCLQAYRRHFENILWSKVTIIDIISSNDEKQQYFAFTSWRKTRSSWVQGKTSPVLRSFTQWQPCIQLVCSLLFLCALFIIVSCRLSLQNYRWLRTSHKKGKSDLASFTMAAAAVSDKMDTTDAARKPVITEQLNTCR
jgi:hypothetical protein